MNCRNRFIACVALMGAPLMASAAIAQKPGLWTLSVEIRQDMPDIDPRMLEQMEMMGFALPQEPLHSSTQQICLTPAQVKLDRLPDIHDEGSGCTARNIRRVGDRATGDLQCEGQLRGGGEVQITLDTPQNYSGSARFEGASQEGLPIFAKGAINGRWIAESCGNVKPFEIPPGGNL